MKSNSRYSDYFPEYSNYFGIALRLLKYMYGMTNSGKLSDDELTEWSLETYFIQSQHQMSIYYKYAPYEKKLLFYLILMIVSIGTLLKLLKNGFWML